MDKKCSIAGSDRVRCFYAKSDHECGNGFFEEEKEGVHKKGGDDGC